MRLVSTDAFPQGTALYLDTVINTPSSNPFVEYKSPSMASVVPNAIIEYVKDVPYIEYDEDRILKMPGLEKQAKMKMWAEYNPYHHETMKQVYEAFTSSFDDTLMKQISIIMEREEKGPYTGGLLAARMNLMTLMVCGFQEKPLPIQDQKWFQHWYTTITKKVEEVMGDDGRAANCGRMAQMFSN